MAGTAVSPNAVLIFTVPNAVLQIGTHGPFSSPAMGGNFSAIEFNITQGPTYPSTGNVITITVEYSTDGGSTWLQDCQATFAGSSGWLDKTNALVNQGVWHVSRGTLNPGPNAITQLTGTTDKFRVTLQALQVCTPIIQLFGVP